MEMALHSVARGSHQLEAVHWRRTRAAALQRQSAEFDTDYKCCLYRVCTFSL